MDDLARAWTDWTAALAAAGFDPRDTLRPPADPAAVAAAQEHCGVAFPDELVALYALADGQGPDPTDPQLLPGHRFLPVADALDDWVRWNDVVGDPGTEGYDPGSVTVREGDGIRREYWWRGWWPLGADGGGNVLVVDTDPAPGGTVGQIVVAGRDEDERRSPAPGLAAWMRALAAADLEVDEVDEGVFWWDAPTLR